MPAQGARGTSSLFSPLNIEDVLIPTEEVRYVERKHGASLIEPFLQTIAALIFITIFAGGLPANAFGGFLAVVAIAMAGVFLFRMKPSRATIVGVTVVVLLAFFALGLQNLAIAAVLVAAGRFFYRFTMWAFYERLFITNRRLMQSTGFLGAQINSIPLTRATDIEYKRTVPGEVLGYGTVRVETAGQDQALGLLQFLTAPDRFYNTLLEGSTTAANSVRPTRAQERIKLARERREERARQRAEALDNEMGLPPDLAITREEPI